MANGSQLLERMANQIQTQVMFAWRYLLLRKRLSGIVHTIILLHENGDGIEGDGVRGERKRVIFATQHVDDSFGIGYKGGKVNAS